jgi:hypothetical protein
MRHLGLVAMVVIFELVAAGFMLAGSQRPNVYNKNRIASFR